MRRSLGLQPGDRLSARLDGGTIVLEPSGALLGRLQDEFSRARGEMSLVDELIAERRGAAKAESEK